MENRVVEMQAAVDNLVNDGILEEQSGRKTSIYRVPPYFISNTNHRAYQPRVVSFGPYHHGEPHLTLMEAHKERAFRHFIHQSTRSIHEVFDIVAVEVRKLMDSYDSLDDKWENYDRFRFIKLMVLDGCFMLELLRVAYKPENYYSAADPIFSEHGELTVMHLIKVDMLLLENQLPMLLLLRLKCIIEDDEPDIEALNKDILSFLNYDINKYSKMGPCLHVLDLHHKALLYTHNLHADVVAQPPNQREENKRDGHKVFRPATELHQAGVCFMTSESISLLDITFNRNDGVLKLPNFIVDDYTESMYLNLIAFERCHVFTGNDITSFVAFMACIIDDHQDIKLLRSKEIINNFIRTDKEAADLFNRVSRDLAIEMNFNSYLVYEDLIYYSNMRRNKWKTRWNKWLANLAQTYFRSPWAIISVIAATLGLSLAVVQTIFIILN